VRAPAQIERAVACRQGWLQARPRYGRHGVLRFLIDPVYRIGFLQTPKEIVMAWGQDFQYCHFYLNVRHSRNSKPSGYGESVGHYEGSATLVVDTIGLDDRTYIDNDHTPRTTKLQVVEWVLTADGGRELEVKVHVEDRGAFSLPWNAVRSHRVDYRAGDVPLHEMACAEDNGDMLHDGLVPISRRDEPVF
jgi:hypothetical protein